MQDNARRRDEPAAQDRQIYTFGMRLAEWCLPPLAFPVIMVLAVLLVRSLKGLLPSGDAIFITTALVTMGLGTLMGCYAVLYGWYIATSASSRRVRGLLSSRHSMDFSDAVYVTIMPETDRVPVGTIGRDIGLILLTAEIIQYYGDTQTFELVPSLIERVEVEEMTVPVFGYPVLRIVWRDPRDNGQRRRLRVCVRDCATPRERIRKTCALGDQIKSWLKADHPETEQSQSLPPVLPSLTDPRNAKLLRVYTHVYFLVLLLVSCAVLYDLVRSGSNPPNSGFVYLLLVMLVANAVARKLIYTRLR